MTNEDRAIATTAGALLGQGRSINLLGIGLTLLAAGALMLMFPVGARLLPILAMGMACAAGALQVVLAVRVAFDAEIFRRFAARDPVALDPLAFDRALHAMGCAPDLATERPMAMRARGALRLFKFQAIACAVQIVGVVVAAALMSV